jgi:hypothetical protein
LQNPDLASTIIKQESEEVFSFPVLTESFCDKLVEEIDNYRKIKKDSGIAMRVSQFGYDSVVKDLVSILHPLLIQLYPSLKNVKYEVYPKLVSDR